MSYKLRVSRTFCAAHFLVGYIGNCSRLHGHTWRVEVEVASTKLDDQGMVADFRLIGEALERLLPDHRYLNDVYDFNPTAENLARNFAEGLAHQFDVSCVAVWESDRCCAVYEVSK